MDRFLDTFFNLEVMGRYLPKILSGMVVTTYLGIGVVISGLAAGLVLAVIRSFGVKPLNALIVLVVDVLRTVPPLVLIVLFFYGLPAVGVPLDGLVGSPGTELEFAL